MKRLCIQSHCTMLNLDHVSSIRIEPEYIRPESGGYRDPGERQRTDYYVVHAENVAIYRSRIEQKCEEFMMRLGNAVCRSPADAVIIATINGKFMYRAPSDKIVLIPDEQFHAEMEQIATYAELPDELGPED